MDDFICIGYKKSYPTLDLKTFKEKPMFYDIGILYSIYFEVKKGFMFKKINKPTRKGTTISYVLIESQEMATNFAKVMTEMLENINQKYGFDIGREGQENLNV